MNPEEVAVVSAERYLLATHGDQGDIRPQTGLIQSLRLIS